MELDDDHTICEETEEMIAEAMRLPEEQRERRLVEIHQHIRFLKGKEKRKKILEQKNHRRKCFCSSDFVTGDYFLTKFYFIAAFDDSNIGLCSVCLDDNFQIVHPCGSDMACSDCLRKMRM